MSAGEHFVEAGAHAAIGAVAGRAIIAGTGMTAAGMVGGGAGIGAAAGPVGAVIGGLAMLAIYGLRRAGRDAAEEHAAVARYYEDQQIEAMFQASEWAEEWAEEAVEVTGETSDTIGVADAVALFDAWLNERLGGWDNRPDGWRIWTSRVAVEIWLGSGHHDTGHGVRLRETVTGWVTG